MQVQTDFYRRALRSKTLQSGIALLSLSSEALANSMHSLVNAQILVNAYTGQRTTFGRRLGIVLEAGQAHSTAKTYEYQPKDLVASLFMLASLVWAIVFSISIAAVTYVLLNPNLMIPEYTFARLRPVPMQIGLFGFACNAFFAAVYFSTQRLCKRQMWSSLLGLVHFVGWQFICVWFLATGILGHVQLRESAEFVWQIDVAIVAVWALFKLNFVLTLLTRRVRHMYISLWYYSTAIIGFLPVFILGNLEWPADGYASASIYTGVMDGFMQSWHAANLQFFLVVMPALGAMYYFAPRISGRPVANYRLAVAQFWLLTILGAISGSRLLFFTPVPEWVTSFGMFAGILMFMPSWVGVTNGLAMLKGPLRDVADSPLLKYFLVGILFFAFASIEGALTSIKSIGGLTGFTEWSQAHDLAMLVGFAGFTSVGVIYWAWQKAVGGKIWNRSLLSLHLWTSVVGSLLLIGGTYLAGYFQASMTHALDSSGSLVYPEFIEIVNTSKLFMWCKLVGAIVLTASGLVMLINLVLTAVAGDKQERDAVESVVQPGKDYQDPTPPKSVLEGQAILQLGVNIDVWSSLVWHRRWERSAPKFLMLIKLAVVVGVLVEFAPMFLFVQAAPVADNVVPYTPLELLGREIYVSQRCSSCHTQAARPLLAEGTRYGDYSLPEDFKHERPSLWGSLRVGPDLSQETGKRTGWWHWQHLTDPQSMTPGSLMPRFDFLMNEKLDIDKIRTLVARAAEFGVPYDTETLLRDDLTEEDRELGEVTPLEETVQKQAESVAADIVKSGGPAAMYDKQGIAVVAYLQRLGAAPAPAAE